jgi:hypothetical protein
MLSNTWLPGTLHVSARVALAVFAIQDNMLEVSCSPLKRFFGNDRLTLLNEAPPLRWKDIEIQRDGEAGKFRLIIHFWNLNIKKPEVRVVYPPVPERDLIEPQDQERAEAERSSDSR